MLYTPNAAENIGAEKEKRKENPLVSLRPACLPHLMTPEPSLLPRELDGFGLAEGGQR